MSLAACAERWARLRTSSATTAKPMPASPARAASTAALSARMLVWKAISSIVLMILEILPLDESISAWPSPSRAAWRWLRDARADVTKPVAWREFSRCGAPRS